MLFHGRALSWPTVAPAARVPVRSAAVVSARAAVLLVAVWLLGACGGAAGPGPWTPPPQMDSAAPAGALPAFEWPAEAVTFDEPATALAIVEGALLRRLQGIVRQPRTVARVVSPRSQNPFAAAVIEAHEGGSALHPRIEHRIVVLVGSPTADDMDRLLAVVVPAVQGPTEEEGAASTAPAGFPVLVHVFALESVPARLVQALDGSWSGALERCLRGVRVPLEAVELSPGVERCFGQVGLSLRDPETGALEPSRLDPLWDALPGRPAFAGPVVDEREAASAPAAPACRPGRGVPCVHAEYGWEFGPFETLRAFGHVLTVWLGDAYPALEAVDRDRVLSQGPAFAEPGTGAVFRPADFPAQAWRAGVPSPVSAWMHVVRQHLDPP